jgi:hypothetical protein
VKGDVPQQALLQHGITTEDNDDAYTNLHMFVGFRLRPRLNMLDQRDSSIGYKYYGIVATTERGIHLYNVCLRVRECPIDPDNKYLLNK